jgi:hypothetical protein
MKNSMVASSLALLVASAGCFKMDVRLPKGTSGGEHNSGGAAHSPSGPWQLPGGGNAPAGDNGNAGGWGDFAAGIAGKVFTDSEQGAVFTAYDSLGYPGQPVELVARLLAASNLQPIPDATVGFHQDGKLLGSARTDANGYARIQVTPAKAGDYQFAARVSAVPASAPPDLVRITPSPILLSARPREAQLVTVDLDHTVVDSGFVRVLLGGARPMPRSADVLQQVAKRYTVVYLTHRPDLLSRRSKEWLGSNGYPPGPLLVSRVSDVFDSGRLKTSRLSALRKSYPNAAIGIGDKISDAQAYMAGGMTAYLIPHYKRKADDMRELAAHIRGLGGDGRLNVVSDWDEIEQGILRGKTYPAAAFTQQLERQARQLEDEERTKERSERKGKGD